MDTSTQIMELKNIIQHLDNLSELIEKIKFSRIELRECDPEDDSVPDFLKWAVDEIDCSRTDIESAIHSLEFEAMSQAEQEEWNRHCFIQRVMMRV